MEDGIGLKSIKNEIERQRNERNSRLSAQAKETIENIKKLDRKSFESWFDSAKESLRAAKNASLKEIKRQFDYGKSVEIGGNILKQSEIPDRASPEDIKQMMVYNAQRIVEEINSKTSDFNNEKGLFKDEEPLSEQKKHESDSQLSPETLADTEYLLDTLGGIFAEMRQMAKPGVRIGSTESKMNAKKAAEERIKKAYEIKDPMDGYDEIDAAMRERLKLGYDGADKNNRGHRKLVKKVFVNTKHYGRIESGVTEDEWGIIHDQLLDGEITLEQGRNALLDTGFDEKNIDEELAKIKTLFDNGWFIENKNNPNSHAQFGDAPSKEGQNPDQSGDGKNGENGKKIRNVNVIIPEEKPLPNKIKDEDKVINEGLQGKRRGQTIIDWNKVKILEKEGKAKRNDGSLVKYLENCGMPKELVHNAFLWAFSSNSAPDDFAEGIKHYIEKSGHLYGYRKAPEQKEEIKDEGGKTEQIFFDFNESEIEGHIAKTVSPQAAASIEERKEYISEHGDDPDNFVNVTIPERYRPFGGWTDFNARLVLTDRVRMNKEAAELLGRADKNYNDLELSIIRRYSGFGGLDVEGERGVLYDYYTSPPVANMTWRMLHKIQRIRKGSGVLEPSCGTGVFFEAAPEGVKLHGVELDERAAGAASALFPGVSITRSSFEGYCASEAGSHKFDHIIGNVPFGERTIQTAFLDMPEEKSLDRYFLKRSVDLLAENGTLALITHPGILENESSSDFREGLIRKAQFLGAVRLNDRTFHHTHTAVQPVIVFLKKYPDDIAQRIASHSDSAIIEELYNDSSYKKFIEGTYFEDYPEHVMGETAEGAGQWGGDVIKGDASQDTLRDMEEAFKPYPMIEESVFQSIRGKYDIVYKKESKDSLALTRAELESVGTKALAAGALKTVESDVYILNDNFRWDLAEKGKGNLALKISKLNIISGQVRSIRLSFRRGEWPASRQAETIKSLEQYRQAHGKYPLEDAEIKSFLRRHPAVRGIYDSFVTPQSEILTTNIYENKAKKLDGYARSIGVLKYFQANLIEGNEENLKKYYPDEHEEIKKEMRQNPDVFMTHNKDWQLREDFIAGNAYMKIDYIQDALNGETDQAAAEKLKYGIEELRKAAGWVTMEDAQFTPHSSWISEYIINEWISDEDGLGNRSLSNKEKKVSKNNDGKWGVRYQNEKTTVAPDYSVKERYEGQWDEAAEPVIYYLNMQKQRSKYIDTETFNRETNELFKSWASGHPRYREILEQKYNRIFNAEIGATVKTYPINIDGWVEENKKLKPHQLQSVNHLYCEGKGISALGTGFGKTLVGIALAALLQQEHKISRAFFQVPNNKVKDWVAEIRDVLPEKKVGFIDPETRGYSSRELRYSQYQKIINGRYDIIIMPESAASEIQLSPENNLEITERIVKGQIMNSTAGKSQRKAATAKESAERKLQDGKTNKVVYFEDFGCDAIFVDEVQRYKNLFASSLSRDTGMNDGRQSAKAMSLFKKTEYVRNNNNDKNVFLFSATPLTNSPLEYYNIIMFVAPEELGRFNINNINEFINNFADIEAGKTYDWQTGQVITKNILTGFKNLRTLQNIFFKYTDYQNDPKKINLEKPDSQNKPNIIAADEKQVQVIRSISAELEQYAATPKEERAEEFPGQNFLTFYSRLRTASLDLSLYDPGEYEKWDNPKFRKLAENAFANYSRTKGGQAVFCDRVFSGDGTFNVHDKIKKYLVDAGYKAEEIIIINGFTKSGAAMSDSALEKETSDAVEAFNKGKYKVIIGTTQCIGEGLNLQANSSAIHHADIPFRPSDFIQRNGRIDRQGNAQGSVELHSYMASGTIDNYSVSLVQRKSDWIDQLLKTKSNVFLNPDDEHFIDADEMLLALTEEWGDPAQAEERRKHMEQMKSEKMKEAQNRERADCLAQLSLLRGAMCDYKGDKGSAAYQARIQKGTRIVKLLENNPTLADKTALQKKEPFIYDRNKDLCIFKGDYAVSNENVYKIDKLNVKNMTVSGSRISKSRSYGYEDHYAYFSEQFNVTKKYHYDRGTIYLCNLPKEEEQYISRLASDLFYEIPSNEFKEKYYYIRHKNDDGEIPAFYVSNDNLIISTDTVYNVNEEIKPLNPFNGYDLEKIESMIKSNKYSLCVNNKEEIAEKLYSFFPGIYSVLSKVDSSVPNPLQKYLSDMEIEGMDDFKTEMKEMMAKFPAEFGKDSLKAAHTIMQNLDDEKKKELNAELVQSGCAGPEKLKKMFDEWVGINGLNPEISKRVIFTGVSMG